VLLAPELAPGRVALDDGCGAGVGSGSGVDVPGMDAPGSFPAGLRSGMPAGVLGAALDLFALGVWLRLPLGVPVPAGAVPGVVVVAPVGGGGGPASGWLLGGGGIRVLLIESAGAPVAEPGVLDGGFTMRGVGVTSFMSGALFPNGLRWSIPP